jgi:hypothetical protein
MLRNTSLGGKSTGGAKYSDSVSDSAQVPRPLRLPGSECCCAIPYFSSSAAGGGRLQLNRPFSENARNFCPTVTALFALGENYKGSAVVTRMGH